MDKKKRMRKIKGRIKSALVDKQRKILEKAKVDAMYDSQNKDFHLKSGEEKNKHIDDHFLTPLSQKPWEASLEAEALDTVIETVIQVEREKKIKAATKPILELGWAFTLLWAALGYFVYEGVDGAAAIVILATFYAVSILLAFIPFCGVIIQGLTMHFLIWPLVVSFTGIYDTWLTGLIFWMIIVIGVTINIIWTLMGIVYLLDRH